MTTFLKAHWISSNAIPPTFPIARYLESVGLARGICLDPSFGTNRIIEIKNRHFLNEGWLFNDCKKLTVMLARGTYMFAVVL